MVNGDSFSIDIVIMERDYKLRTIEYKCGPGTSFQNIVEDLRCQNQIENNISYGYSVWGGPCTLDKFVKKGDRFEVCQPLLLSPNEARMLRAKRQRGGKK